MMTRAQSFWSPIATISLLQHRLLLDYYLLPYHLVTLMTFAHTLNEIIKLTILALSFAYKESA